jgi:exosortase D (VPLPA-CTERM-specific)
LLLLFGAAFVLTGFAFWGGLENLVFRWAQSEEYSHGFFIPIITAYLLWHRREAIVRSIGTPSAWGLVLIALALALLVVGELSAIFILIHLGFILVLMGLVLALGGVSLLRVTFLPLAFLVFAIPTPYFIDAQLSYRLQLISSQLGADMLRLIGVSVYVEGNVIDLGEYKLQVVEACSGLRYLYPLLSLGFLAAYLFKAPLWQRIVVFLSTVPITVLMNSFRIAVIGVLVQQWGREMADGFLHFFEGWVIFMVCTLLLMGEIWLFSRLNGQRDLGQAFGLREVAPVAPKEQPVRHLQWPLATSVVLSVLAVAMVSLVSGREEHQASRARLATFPLVLGDWQARESSLDPLVEEYLGLDDYLKADFVRGRGEAVNFYVAHYATQRKGVSPHSPRVCIPGGGWHIRDLERSEPAQVPGQTPFPINRVIIERGNQRSLVYYWFEQRGRRIANEYAMKAYLLYDAVFRNRTDGALVRLTTPIYEGEPIEKAEERLQSLMALVVPRLPEFVPK